MQTATHETDLYVLPDNPVQAGAVIAFLNQANWHWRWSRSDVPGQDWYGKHFIEVPFGISLKDRLIERFQEQGEPCTSKP